MGSFIRFIIWTILWIVIWPFVRPFKSNKNNCLVWAWDKWNNEGGYLVIRWCRVNRLKWVRWPHFLWLNEKHHKFLEHYTPVRDLDIPVRREWIPHPWFEGRIAKGDYRKEYINTKLWFIPNYFYKKFWKRPAIEN